MGDGKDSFMNDIKDHRNLINGYYYWIIRLNAKTRRPGAIKDGDLVRAYNDRGSVILAAQVGERVPPGVAHSYSPAPSTTPLGNRVIPRTGPAASTSSLSGSVPVQV
jgi:trimethylamine-N-oxide reductase (cytochrome c)